MLNLDNISIAFKKEEPVLSNVSLIVNKGELISILGSNGSGKSTLLKIVYGLFTPDNGKVILDKVDITHLPSYRRASIVHYLEQSREQNLSPALTLMDIFMITLSNNKAAWYFLRPNFWKQRIINILEPLGLGLEYKLTQQLKDFSGGEIQSLSVVLMIELIMQNINSNHILLLDEHTAHLDNRLADKIMNITMALVRTNKITTVMVTHSIDAALANSDRIVVLRDHSIAACFNMQENSSLSLKHSLKNRILSMM